MEKFGNEGRMCMNMLWIRWKQSIENLKEDRGIGVVEVLLILVVDVYKRQMQHHLKRR